MVGKTEQPCPVDIRKYNRQRKEQQIFFPLSENSGNDAADRWQTSTQEAFNKPQVQNTSINGRRKDLLRKTLNERVLQQVANQMDSNDATEDGEKPSEYIDNFCDPKFTPFMDQKSDNFLNKFMRYSLYTCNNQTLYKEKLEKGELKSRTEISNWNEPFRKNCAFTTSPDLAFREPTGGY